jgi:Peptidase family C25
VVPSDKDSSARSRRCLGEWKVKHVFVAGEVGALKLDGCRVTSLPRAADVRSAYLRKLGERVDRAVVVNPADLDKGMGGMSALAPWLAVQKKAVLLQTGADGTDVPRLVKEAGKREPLTHLATLILLANLKAIPMQQRPNPIPGDKDKVIDMEPLTPPLGEPFSYAVGRLFHEDRAVVPLMLARQRWMASKSGPYRALVASNPGGSLPLLETFSRNTAKELSNAGWNVTALYDHDVTPAALRKKMVGADLFLWEGHHNTLVKEWGFTTWDEPLSPTFVLLQSCLALMEEKVQPLLARGAVGVLGTSTRTYSGSGGAFSLAFLDGCVYDDRPLGDSLRQAKNFLVCYAALKQKRLADQAVRTGANHRASWAFTLWGDPTFRLPHPPRPDPSLSLVRQEVSGNSITVEIPSERHGKVSTAKYQVGMPANARLAGLIRKEEGKDRSPLVPFYFTEVHLPKAPPGLTPRLRSRLPASQWVFVWDGRRKTGYLLVMSSRRDASELRFRVEWPGPVVVGRDTP